MEEKRNLKSKEIFTRNSQTKIVPCIPYEHQKTLQCSTCMVAPGTLVSAGQELCSAFIHTSNANKHSVRSIEGYLRPYVVKKPKLKPKPVAVALRSNRRFVRTSFATEGSKIPGMVTKLAPSSLFYQSEPLSQRIKLAKQINKPTFYAGRPSAVQKFKLENLATPESGQVIKIDGDKITLRRAHCYFISSKSELSVVNNEYIKKGNVLFNLKYEKLLTGDIVQGLSKIEELLEYPKLSLNLNFKVCLRRYLTKVSLSKAIQWSYNELQGYLVQSIQQVYVDQGCFISDKHLEIIVRQATCLGIILFPGDTGFLHHEVVNIDAIEKINKGIQDLENQIRTTKGKQSFPRVVETRLAQNVADSTASLRSRETEQTTEGNYSRLYRRQIEDLYVTKVNNLSFLSSNKKSVISKPKGQANNKKRQAAIYYPHLKGITWNSLNSDSILSAASFQETRRVLRDNLVTDKVDFLKGIKERIILGELLEIGTGFYKNHF